jgi:carboxypeptidase C (cathepsin A)
MSIRAIIAMLNLRFLCAVAGLVLLMATPLQSQGSKQAEISVKAEDPTRLLPADSTTNHVIALGEKKLAYSATAGTLPIFGAKGEVAAKIFYVAYRLDGQPSRPVTFVFNGGPGAGSAFLQLGAIGPRVVNFTPNGAAATQPVQLSDNSDSWLDFTDLVFIDPVSTGFSRTTTASEDAEKAFWSVDKDADALAGVIRLYLGRNGRELSPVFIAGESYGGFRGPLLMNRLLGAGVQVKGAVLISPALEFSMLRSDHFLLGPLVTDLPSIAASHLEMTRGQDKMLDAMKEVETFTWAQYLTFLASGEKPDDALIAKLSEYTGLSSAVIARASGRVSTRLFSREYRRAHDRALSYYDGTVTIAMPRGDDGVHIDPILDVAATALQPAMEKYARSELNFPTDLQYELLNRRVADNWDYGTKPNRQGFAGALEDLEKARVKNPHLEVLIASGYTDLVVPYAGSQLLVRQLNPIEGAKPVVVKVYPGGHMMYLRSTSRRDLKRDAAALYADALSQN